MDLLRDAADAPAPSYKPAALDSRHLSAAQDFFFRQHLAQPHHHNQALLLACGVPVDVSLMREAVARLVEGHASLRTAYGADDRGRIARLTAVRRADLLSHSVVPAQADGAAIDAQLDREAQSAQQALHLSDGSLLRAHVFKFETGADQLLLVAHHVAVDVISWRILVADLSRLYSDLQAGRPAVLPTNPHSFLGLGRSPAKPRSCAERPCRTLAARCRGRIGKRAAGARQRQHRRRSVHAVAGLLAR